MIIINCNVLVTELPIHQLLQNRVFNSSKRKASFLLEPSRAIVPEEMLDYYFTTSLEYLPWLRI